MIRLVCKSCGKVWYTANTRYVPKCDDCGGLLEEKEEEINKGLKDKSPSASGLNRKTNR